MLPSIRHVLPSLNAHCVEGWRDVVHGCRKPWLIISPAKKEVQVKAKVRYLVVFTCQICKPSSIRLSSAAAFSAVVGEDFRLCKGTFYSRRYLRIFSRSYRAASTCSPHTTLVPQVPRRKTSMKIPWTMANCEADGRCSQPFSSSRACLVPILFADPRVPFATL